MNSNTSEKKIIVDFQFLNRPLRYTSLRDCRATPFGVAKGGAPEQTFCLAIAALNDVLSYLVNLFYNRDCCC
jgi:hypothetical protein